MKYLLVLLLSFILTSHVQVHGQDTITRMQDTTGIATPDTSHMISADHAVLTHGSTTNKQRLRFVTTANIIFHAGITYGLYSAWYTNKPQSRFHFFNDNKEWLQMDKIGHVYSAYTGSRMSMEMWRWTGMPRKQSIWISAVNGLAYQTLIEAMDGFSVGWGWSWGDFAANIAGSGMFVAQELAWDQQKILFKFSFHRKTYHGAVLNERANDLFGHSLPERMLKDYNGQTYWLSANPRSLFKHSTLPKWLNIAVGHSAEGLLDADENLWKDKNGVDRDATQIKRYRQFFLSPDIDLSRIRTKSRFMRIAFFVLNAFKFPAPSLEFSNNKLRFQFIHF